MLVLWRIFIIILGVLNWRSCCICSGSRCESVGSLWFFVSQLKVIAVRRDGDCVYEVFWCCLFTLWLLFSWIYWNEQWSDVLYFSLMIFKCIIRNEFSCPYYLLLVIPTHFATPLSYDGFQFGRVKANTWFLHNMLRQRIHLFQLTMPEEWSLWGMICSKSSSCVRVSQIKIGREVKPLSYIIKVWPSWDLYVHSWPWMEPMATLELNHISWFHSSAATIIKVKSR